MTSRLVVIPFVPASNAPQAGHRLAYEAVKSAVEEGAVHVLLLLKSAAPLPEEFVALCGKDNVSVIVVSRWRALGAWLGNPGVYPRFLTRFARSAVDAIAAHLETKPCDEIRLEFSQTFVYANAVRKAVRTPVRIALVAHDLQVQVVARQSNWEYWLMPWVLRTESRAIRAADELIVLSEKDAVLVTSLIDFPGKLTVNVPAPARFTAGVRRTPEKLEKNSLLFWGAMGRAENEEAVLRFHRDVLDPLRREGFSYKLYVVGSNPGQRVLDLESDGCVVTGFVDDPTTYFERCAIGVVPLLRGAGIKLKTLEMLACGLPVLSTPIGAEGIEGSGDKMTVCALSDFKRHRAERYERG